MFPELIETSRLRFERFDTAVETETLYRHAGKRRSETITEETTHVTWSPHDHPKESNEVLAQFGEAWEAGDTMTYAVVPKAGEPNAGAFAGNAGMSFDWDTLTATLGVWLRKPFWGRRYSGERARALATLAFERYDMEVVAVDVFPDNEQSIRAVERYVDQLGGRRVGVLRNHVLDDRETVHDAIRFSVSREEFREADPDVAVETTDTLDESALDESVLDESALSDE